MIAGTTMVTQMHIKTVMIELCFQNCPVTCKLLRHAPAVSPPDTSYLPLNMASFKSIIRRKKLGKSFVPTKSKILCEEPFSYRYRNSLSVDLGVCTFPSGRYFTDVGFSFYQISRTPTLYCYYSEKVLHNYDKSF